MVVPQNWYIFFLQRKTDIKMNEFDYEVMPPKTSEDIIISNSRK